MYIGFFNVNKPKGMTSAAVVGRLKFILKQKGLGHMGTLDPMAEGVLPIAAGRPATKMFDFLQSKKKCYIAEFTFGFSTDTLDTEGVVTESGGRIPSEEEIRSVLNKFTGKLQQIPPMYSAKSVNGVRAYKLARQGITVELKPKEVEIFDLHMLERVSDTVYRFEILCGSGTYIRSLARDIGAELGTLCVMSALTRTQSGFFRLENSATLEEIEKNPEKYLVDIETVRNSISDGNSNIRTKI